MTPTIRDATEEDIGAIAALSIAGTVEPARYPPLDLSDPGYLIAFKAIDADPNHRLIVADLEGEVIGCMQISFIPGIPGGGAWRGQLENVHVHSDFRGQGIGAMMTQWAIALCRDRGCDRVQLTSNKKRKDAHRFYERLGFEATHQGFKLKLE